MEEQKKMPEGVTIGNQGMTSVELPAKSNEMTQEEIQKKEQEAVSRAEGKPKAATAEEPTEINWEKRYKDLQSFTDSRFAKLEERLKSLGGPKDVLSEPETAQESVEDSPKGKSPGDTQASQEGASEEQQKASLEDTLKSLAENPTGITVDSLESLKEAGVPEVLLEQIRLGQEARQREIQRDVLGVLSPDMDKANEAYNRMIDWGKTNLTDKEIQTFDSLVSSGDPVKMKTAIQSLANRYARDRGSVVDNFNPGGDTFNGPSDSRLTFSSREEMMAAMRDPRYQKDPHYQAEVERKAAVFISRKR